MKTVETWRWRIKWGGKWATAPGYWTEAEIRREHREAERLPGSMQPRPAPAGTGTEANRVPADAMDPRIALGWEVWQRRRRA